MHKGLISEFDYYFTYVNPNENKNCPYCGNLKKPISYSAMRSTCCSRECKSLFSRKGALSQIDSEGGVDVWHQKRINKRNELYPSLNSEIAVKMNNTLNENRRNNGFRSIEEAILYEAILKEFPDINIIPDDKRFFTSRKHRLADDGLNTILDFGFPDYCLNVEVDGGYHYNRQQVDSERDAKILNRGWKVLRLTNDQVNNEIEKCLELIREQLV
jgi:hypothetical protein